MAEYKSNYTGEQIDAAIEKANSALQEELEPAFNASASKDITNVDITSWNAKAELSDIPDVSNFITKDVNNLTNYELKVSTANNILVSINSDTYVMTIALRNSNNEVLNMQTVDLPLETMVVGGSYDSTNKKIVLTLKNGNTIDVPVGDLINGLQSEITSTNKLDASLVDDSLSSNKFVTSAEKQTWNDKANASDIPTLVSELTNDSNYQTLIDVQNLINNMGLYKTFINSSSYYSPYIKGNMQKGVYFLYGKAWFKNLETDPNPSSILSAQGTSNLQMVPDILILDKNVSEAENNELFGLVIGCISTSRTVSGHAFRAGECFAIKLRKYNNSFYLPEYDYNVWGSSYQFVLNDAAQTIKGVKTFENIPKQNNTTAPTQDAEFTNKKYVDDSISNAITTTLNGSY